MKEQKTKKYPILAAAAALLTACSLTSPALALSVPKEFDNGLPGYFAVPDCLEVEKTRIHSRHFSFKRQYNRSRLSLYEIENINQDFFVFHENGSSYAGRLFEDGVIELSSIEKGGQINKDKDWENQNIIQRHEYMGCYDIPDNSVLATSLKDLDALYNSCQENANKSACQTAFFSTFDKNDNQSLDVKEIKNMMEVTLDIGYYYTPLSRPNKYTQAQKLSKINTLTNSLYTTLNKEQGTDITIYDWAQYHILPTFTTYESQDITHNLKRLFPALIR